MKQLKIKAKNMGQKDKKEAQLEKLEQYIQENDANGTYQMLNDMQINYPIEDWENFSHYLIYSAVMQRSLALLKTVKHPIFLEADNSFAYENIRTRVAQIVAEEKAYDFIAPTILASLTTMADYTFEMINEVDIALCDYVLNDEMLDFNYEYLQEAYPTIFSLSSKQAVDIADKLAPIIQMNDKVMQNSIQNALNKHDSSGIEYLMSHYPEQMLKTMSIWIAYIQQNVNKSNQDELHLLQGVDLYTSSPETLSAMFNLINEHFQLDKPHTLIDYFLRPFLNGDEENNHLEHLIQFLDDVYTQKGEIVPEKAYFIIEHLRPHLFKNFKVHYEAHLLEQSVEKNNNSPKKMKL